MQAEEFFKYYCIKHYKKTVREYLPILTMEKEEKLISKSDFMKIVPEFKFTLAHSKYTFHLKDGIIYTNLGKPYMT